METRTRDNKRPLHNSGMMEKRMKKAPIKAKAIPTLSTRNQVGQ